MPVVERDVLLELIDAHPRQPRLEFPAASIASLAATLADPEVGLLQRVVVRPRPGCHGRFELLAGERRVRAAREAGWDSIPATVRDVDDRTAIRILVIENIERRQLNPLERAFAVAELHRPVDEGGAGMSLAEIGQQFGHTSTWACNALRLLRVPEPWRSQLIAGELDESKALLLLGYEGEPAILEAIRGELEEDPEGWQTFAQWHTKVRTIADDVRSRSADPPPASAARTRRGPSDAKPARTSARGNDGAAKPAVVRRLSDEQIRKLLKPYARNAPDLAAIRDACSAALRELRAARPRRKYIKRVRK